MEKRREDYLEELENEEKTELNQNRELIVCTQDTCGGEPRIDGRRITIENIVRTVFSLEDCKQEVKDLFLLSDKEYMAARNYICKLLRSNLQIDIS